MQIGDVDVRVSEILLFRIIEKLRSEDEPWLAKLHIVLHNARVVKASYVTDEQIEALRYALDGNEPPVASGGDACFATMPAQTIARGVTLQAICVMPKGHKGFHGFELTEWKVTQRSPYEG